MHPTLKQIIDSCNGRVGKQSNITVSVNDLHKCFPNPNIFNPSLPNYDELNRWINHIRAVHGIECRLVENSVEPPHYQFKKKY